MDNNLSTKLSRINSSTDRIRKFIKAEDVVIEEVASMVINDLTTKDNTITELNTTISHKDNEISELNNTVADKDQTISQKETELEAEHAKVLTYIDMCDEQTREINTLNERIAELENGGASGSSGLYQVATIDELNALLEV